MLRDFPGALALPDRLPFAFDLVRLVTMLGHCARRLAACVRRIPAERGLAVRCANERSPDVTPTQKGSIAEAVIAAEAVKAGVTFCAPLPRVGRYDLVFEINERFVRVQCKSGKRCGDVIIVPTRTSRAYAARLRADEVRGLRGGRDRGLLPRNRRCYLRPIDGRSRQVGDPLRLAPREQPRVRDNLCRDVRVPWGYSSAGRARDWQSRESPVRARLAPLSGRAASRAALSRSGRGAAGATRRRAWAPRPRAARAGRTRAPPG